MGRRAARAARCFALVREREELSAWRNKPLNPFAEPPFQVLWIGNGDENLFAFRAHHAVVDGEGFFGVCAEALRAVANVCNERLLGVRRPDAALVSIA